MKKTTAVILSTLATAVLVSLIIYGFKHTRGVPVKVQEEPAKVFIKAPFMDEEIDLSKGVELAKWSSIPSNEIELVYQVMVLPWGKSLVSPIFVKAFHNKKDIYFYIKWKDSSENRKQETHKFSDSAAIMFPIDDNAQPSSLMMGFIGGANLWHWRAVDDSEFWLKEGPEVNPYTDFFNPFEKEELFIVQDPEITSAVGDLMAIRVATITRKENQMVQGRGVWDDGVWHVVVKRSLAHIDDDTDATFTLGKKRLCAFAVWEGESGDRGGRKSISNWIDLELE